MRRETYVKETVASTPIRNVRLSYNTYENNSISCIYSFARISNFFIYIYIYMGRGESKFNSWGSGGSALVLFLFYVNVTGMRPRSRLSSQPLEIPASWVLLQVWWSIPLVPPWITASRFLAENRVAVLKPTTFSSLLLFLVFPVCPLIVDPYDMVPLTAAC